MPLPALGNLTVRRDAAEWIAQRSNGTVAAKPVIARQSSDFWSQTGRGDQGLGASGETAAEGRRRRRQSSGSLRLLSR
jgi:hypothetical protein